MWPRKSCYRENEKSSAELTVGRRGSGVALVSQYRLGVYS